MNTHTDVPTPAGPGQPPKPEPGPKFFVNIEGVVHEWPRRTITAREIAALGGWDVHQGVLLIDADNNERQLAPDEIIELRPGQGFAKRIRFKRG